jgi:hypothetical protein
MIAGANELRAAAELIRTGGLCKHMLSDDEGRHCAVGALFAGTVGRDLIGAVLPTLDAVASEMFPGQFEHEVASLVQFNNHPDTTAEDVISVLEKAAARLEEKVA